MILPGLLGLMTPAQALTVQEILAKPEWDLLTDEFYPNIEAVGGLGASGAIWNDDAASRDPNEGLRGAINNGPNPTAYGTAPTYSTSVSDQEVMGLSDSYGLNGSYIPTGVSGDNAQWIAYTAERGRLQTRLVSGSGWNLADARAAFDAHIVTYPADAGKGWIININNGMPDIDDAMNELDAITTTITGAGGWFVIVGIPIPESDPTFGVWASVYNPRAATDYPNEFVDTQDALNNFPDGVHPDRPTAERMADKIWAHMQGRSLGLTFSNIPGVDPIVGGILAVTVPINWTGSAAAAARNVANTATAALTMRYTGGPDNAQMVRNSKDGSGNNITAATSVHNVTQGVCDVWVDLWRGISHFGQFNGVKQPTNFIKLVGHWGTIDTSNPIGWGSGNTNKGECRTLAFVKRGSQPTDAEVAAITDAFQGKPWATGDAVYNLWDNTRMSTGSAVEVIAASGRSRLDISTTSAGIGLSTTGFNLLANAAWEIRHTGSMQGSRTVSGVSRTLGSYDIDPRANSDVVCIYGNNGQLYNNDGGVPFFGSSIPNNWYMIYAWNASTQEITVYHKANVGNAYTEVGSFSMAGKMGSIGTPITWYPCAGTVFVEGANTTDYDLNSDQGAFTDTSLLSEAMPPLSDV